jgi:hypothetical protein
MLNPLRNISQAAEYTGTTDLFLSNQIKNGRGPKFIVPGKRRRFFLQEDLDDWMKGWRKRDMQQTKITD